VRFYLLVDLPVMCVAGAIIGYFVLQHSKLRFVAALLFSLVWYVIIAWKFGYPNQWSWHTPIISALSHAWLFILFFFLPTFGVSELAEKGFRKRSKEN